MANSCGPGSLAERKRPAVTSVEGNGSEFDPRPTDLCAPGSAAYTFPVGIPFTILSQAASGRGRSTS